MSPVAKQHSRRIEIKQAFFVPNAEVGNTTGFKAKKPISARTAKLARVYAATQSCTGLICLSAIVELRRQSGHKRYEPVWLMMHKLRDVMGQRDALL